MVKIIVRSKLKRVTYIEKCCIVPGDNSIVFENILDNTGKIMESAEKQLEKFKNSHYLSALNNIPGQVEILDDGITDAVVTENIELFKNDVELPKSKKKK
jgi:hypothetical protein